MKKLLSLLLAITMLTVMFAGCTEAGTDQTPNNAQSGTGNADEEKEKPSTGETTGEPTTENKLDKILASGKIVMATSPDFAPMEFVDYTKSGQDQYVGADIALGYYIAEQLGVELEVKAMDFTTVLASVTTGSVDMAISGLAWREERAETMGLSTPYDFESESKGHGLIVPTDKLGEYTTPESFVGKTVAAQANSLQYGFCETQLPEGVIIQPISNLADAIMMLKTGKVDAVASSGGTGELLIKGMEDQYAFCDFYFEYESEGNVIAVTKGEDELLAKINEIIDKANADGVLPPMYAEAKELADSLGIE